MRRYPNFITKLLSLVIIAAVLICYQHVAKKRARAVAENRAAIEEAEAYNSAVSGNG